MTASPDASALVCRGVSARYGRVHVVREVELEVNPSEVVAVLGPNGAGKTSLLGSIAGIVRGAGTVTVSGRRMDRMSAYRRARHGLALVPEDRGLFPAMTVRENLQLGARLSAEPDAAIARAIELFPILGDRLGQRAGMMSGGEQQMTAIAKALAAGPAVLMLDEPTQGLAPAVHDHLVAALGRLRDDGLAVLLVEQNHAFAARLADRFYVLTAGRITAAGGRVQLSERESVIQAYLSTA